MLQLTETEKEYVVTRLMGPQVGKRRSENELLSILQKEQGNDTEQRMKKLSKLILAIEGVGKDAEYLANVRCCENSNAYAELEQKAINLSDIAQWYMRKKYLEKWKETTITPNINRTIKKTRSIFFTQKTQSPRGNKQKHNYCSKSGKHYNNEIPFLTPTVEWDLYIDESGSDPDFSTGGNGVVAGVLMDRANKLPKGGKLHACEDYTEEKLKAGDKIIENIIHSPNTGVLVLPTKVYQESANWGDLIISFISLILRIIPLGKEKTKLNVFVENRGIYNTTNDFRFMEDACRSQIIHTWPERSSLIDFKIECMTKDNLWNAYPDIVSHTCFAYKNNTIARKRLNASQWEGKCFLNYPASELSNFWDCIHFGKIVQPAIWTKFVKESGSSKQNVVSYLLQTLGEEIRNDIKLWKTFLDYFVEHLNSKSIDINVLGQQVKFLKKFQPVEATIPLRVRLLWYTAILAEENHRGCIIATKNEKNILQLVRDLFLEDAPLTCWAMLHLAVSYTNSYEFQRANDLLEHYLECIEKNVFGNSNVEDAEPVDDVFFNSNKNKSAFYTAVLGLQYCGQLISSHGQHKAFLGENEKAAKCFQKAIHLFEKINAEGGKDDSYKTSAYLMTSLMECKKCSKDALEKVAKMYLGDKKNNQDLTTITKALSVDISDENKYRHHILLRYILSEKADKKLRQIYMETQKKWDDGFGHPWELIEFYRALLVKDKNERIAHLKKAHDLCQGFDATLHVIDAVILGALLLDDNSVLQEYTNKVTQCQQELPALGTSRINVLNEQPQRKRTPLELASLILPFNFR